MGKLTCGFCNWQGDIDGWEKHSCHEVYKAEITALRARISELEAAIMEHEKTEEHEICRNEVMLDDKQIEKWINIEWSQDSDIAKCAEETQEVVAALVAEIESVENRYKSLYEKFLTLTREKDAEIERLKETRWNLAESLASWQDTAEKAQAEIERLKGNNAALLESNKMKHERINALLREVKKMKKEQK